jgi:hypothetical protein
MLVAAPDTSPGTDLRIPHGDDGACIFRERQRCSIHAQGGEAALPVSCRHYPRVVLRDPLHTRISLSHYCPTAASMLFAPGRPSVVDAAGRLTIDEPVEGLDARDALPPLLRPGMLTDLAGYNAWEAECVATLGSGMTTASALDVVTHATEVVRRWTPADGALADTVAAAFEAAPTRPAATLAWDVRTGGAILRSLTNDPAQAVDGEPPELPPELDRAVANYLAARVFANWIAYQGRGLRTVVAWLHACHELVRTRAREFGGTARADLVAAIRHADLILLHTIDSQAFARAAITIEN